MGPRRVALASQLTPCFIIHIFAKYGFEKVIFKGLSNKG
jgi:hypothetical protein